MKYFKRLKVYKNSNGSNIYNPEKVEAVSYNWWLYLTKYKGKVIFNNASYSGSTSAHQSEVMALVGEENIDLVLQFTRLSLADCEKAIEDEILRIEAHINGLKNAINTPSTWESKNAQRKEEIKTLKNQKKKLKKFLNK